MHSCLASSAAGHYVPAIGAEIVTSNSLYAQNLKGIGELNAPHTAQGTRAQGQVVHGANTYVRTYVWCNYVRTYTVLGYSAYYLIR